MREIAAEQRFLEKYDPSAFDRPSLAVDVVLLTILDNRLRCLVIPRTEHPHRNRWGLPGGFVRIDESLDAAVARVLSEKVDRKDVFVEQLYTFGDPKRDPRMRIVSVAYYALVAPARIQDSPHGCLADVEAILQNDQPVSVELRDERGRVLQTAFDHDQIIGTAVERLRGKLEYAQLGYELLPRSFTLRALQRVHEAILGRPVNKDSFRRKILASGQIEATGEREVEVGHRPAQRYRYVGRRIRR